MKNGEVAANFYADMSAFQSFQEIDDAGGFQSAPKSWFIAFTDVEGSTKAIEAGRYKEVNTIGVAAIIALKNACDDTLLPYVFGGDGATFLFPPEYLQKATQALQQLQLQARNVFQLGLRCAVIPIADLQKEVLVGKLRLSEGNFLAVFSGGGLNESEALAKGDGAAKYLVARSASATSPNLDGLECRWNPIRPKGDEFMSLIILSRQAPSDEIQFFKNLAIRINEVVAINYLVKPEILDLSWPPKHLKVEAKAKFKSKLMQNIFYCVLAGLSWIFIKIIKKAQAGNTKNKVTAYLDSLAKNTDHFKVDDALRMVLDVNSSQKSALVSLLEDQRIQGKIFYGYFSSNHALMTCFVRSLSEHIHFIDGGDGGYAMAAKMLKAQKAAVQP